MEHDFVPSTLGHGTVMCRRCYATEKELEALGKLAQCDGDPVADAKTVPGTVQIIEDGKVVQTETMHWHLMPPKPGLCAVCAHDHAPDEPHNAQSMYYCVLFNGQHGRAPTWADACAHCDPAAIVVWRRELMALGAWTDPPAGEFPIAQPYEVQK